MRAVVQRVREASCTVDGVVTGACGRGVLVLLGVAPDDGPDQAAWMAAKIAGLRIFPDPSGKMNRSLRDDGLGALAISQFTLYGDCRKGRRPSFVKAARPKHAEPLYDAFCAHLEAAGIPVGRGVFGAHMDIALVNDGPVTLVIDTP